MRLLLSWNEFHQPKDYFQQQDCFFIRKIISLETTKTVELKNIVLLVAKKICEAQLT